MTKQDKKQEWREKWDTNQSKQRKTAEGYNKLKVWQEKHDTTFDFFYSLHLQELEKIREMIKGMKGHRAGCLNEEYPDDCDCGQFATEMARDDFTSNNR